MSKTFFSLDSLMNHDAFAETDNNNNNQYSSSPTENEEYVFVEFDNEMEVDEDSYDHCDDGEELSLTPSTSASVCSETMFGDLGPIQPVSSSGSGNGNDLNDKMTSNNSTVNSDSTEVSGKPRSCSIVSLHDEEVQVPQPEPKSIVQQQDEMDIDMEDEEEKGHPKPMKDPQDDSKAAAGVVAVASAVASASKPNSKAKDTSSSRSKKKAKTESEADEFYKLNIGSRMSNKKRRKKMKQLKKAAALAAFTAMKDQSSMQSISTPTSPSVSLKQNTSSKQTQNKLAHANVNTLPKSQTRRISNSIAVMCATETLASYREDLKEELKMKKKINGTLNFEPF
mmetsp:Transcript_10251/g.15410  ORF Transcript_10251/g.15410 Transcript_10251/m.15410 type:complete len:339 (-) Transcript_10251:835-1851(-)|eukprot:CAMPEP_0203735366 /NCGR_PEP_ID=MMETSP0092-20131115/32237_1 /ASSEMBLY_ACC=CAM_ASM_001090 /TAXON_ID=426623 /ORGANISM="Chaetoceros affinis, Strain CCMP159" /LENGTH=338 /DNA_ID=CAMNT_0050619897 /DNA_START=26 /DNA_END=1042 /DNA_ORIENTATION=+